ncbi:hypothetical protein FGO68_gene4458 [Halteria grandinella]|uniref:Uncharacterized protein n=1 Tax=Halteria grandinella TaxID=5974 RepID=A0A8J8P2B1_HALGN|nr:hypothetical protein FGO68_gene4458 [Halteria grandinella]
MTVWQVEPALQGCQIAYHPVVYLKCARRYLLAIILVCHQFSTRSWKSIGGWHQFYDLHSYNCPLSSIPHYFGATRDTLPPAHYCLRHFPQGLVFVSPSQVLQIQTIELPFGGLGDRCRKSAFALSCLLRE